MFAGLALILAALGVYGTLSHSIAQRTHEFGIRTALGARRSDVLRLVFRQGFKLVGAGIGIGLLVSLASTRAMASHLFEISSADPMTFAGVALLLIAVAAVACYLPARRAASVDPMVALRCE